MGHMQERMIGLAEKNDSGYFGTGWFGPSADIAQTEGSVFDEPIRRPASLSPDSQGSLASYHQ